LLANDLVDIVATDYAGGDWDNVYFSLGRAVADGVVGLPKAVALATRNVTLAYPTLAPERGEIRAGCVADIVVCREQLQNVERVYIGGRLVCERGAVRQGELIREGAG
jgi:alpha-D-ribose 1-methylphosphonate 5-triphosphate diphosphatase PhnM